MNRISRNSFDVSLAPNGTVAYQKDSKRDVLEAKFQEIAESLAGDSDGMLSADELLSRPCPICSNDSGHELVIRKYGVPIVACGKCGFWFATPIIKATVDPMSNIWQGAFDDIHIRFLQSETYKKLAALRYGYELDVIEKVVAPQGKTLLDIGCGTGDFLRLARDRGWSVHGVEVNPIAAEIASRTLDNVSNAFFSPELYSPEQRFDAVVTLDTLEHIPDPDPFVAGIRQVLADGGTLLIQVPNATSLSARLKLERDNMFNGLIHFNYFDKSSLKRLMGRHGFELVSYETVITELSSIQTFDGRAIREKARELTGTPVQDGISPDFILDNDLGYKSISLYRAV